MLLLDKLLPWLQSKGSRVLICSQMARMLDILEDYLLLRGYRYCRIDGTVSKKERQASLDAFNKEDSDKFIFLLSTRAVNAEIKLSTADTVILYDCDSTPYRDLQAVNCAHRVGRQQPVHVYRFCASISIEEEVIWRAMKRLKLDAIDADHNKKSNHRAYAKRQGHMADAAQKLSLTGGSTELTDVDAFIAKAEQDTKRFHDRLARLNEAAENYVKETARSAFEFEGTEEANDVGNTWDEDMNILDDLNFQAMSAANWTQPSKKEQKPKSNTNKRDQEQKGKKKQPTKRARKQ